MSFHVIQCIQLLYKRKFVAARLVCHNFLLRAAAFFASMRRWKGWRSSCTLLHNTAKGFLASQIMPTSRKINCIAASSWSRDWFILVINFNVESGGVRWGSLRCWLCNYIWFCLDCISKRIAIVYGFSKFLWPLFELLELISDSSLKWKETT